MKDLETPRVLRDIGKAIAAYHAIAWVALFLAPYPKPSGWMEILMAPTLALAFSALTWLGGLDGVATAGWAIALTLTVVAVAARARSWLWLPVLGALLVLGFVGARLALQSASV